MATQGRNRPRSSLLKDDIADEQHLWNSIVEKVKRCNELSRRCNEITATITSLTEEMGKDESPKRTLALVEEQERQYREGVKLAEEEMKTLHEEPDDLIRNLETLISVKGAFENEVPARAIANSKQRNPKRRLESELAGYSDASTPTGESAVGATSSRLAGKNSSRSGSVAAASVKSEASVAAEGSENNSSKDKPANKFDVGSEVFYRNAKKTQEGEGILCKITKISGDGKQRRNYEVKDMEPELDEDGNEPPPWKAFVQSLIAIPVPGTTLPDLPKGKQVLALYPQTTTFYKAEMVGMRKDGSCRLRFEGEDEKDKELDVDRRYVLDVK